MATRNQLSHQCSGEWNLGQRLDYRKFPWRVAAENIAWTTNRTTAGVVAVQRAMYNEKAPNNGHRLNILNAKYRYVGVSVTLDSTHRKLWVTVDFAGT
jgi:uncharacterized protein YkwD